MRGRPCRQATRSQGGRSMRGLRGGVRRLRSAGLGLAFAALVAGPASAQGSPTPTPVPDTAIAAALGTAPGSMALLDQYLGGARVPPAAMVRRATALIRALGAQRAAIGAQDLVKALDRITGYAARLLASASVMRFAVDDAFRPGSDTLALDFGPADAPVMPGFEKLAPNDPRIAGARLSGLRRPLHQPLQASGIVGVERITLQVPPGDYRIVLVTQHLGDPRLMDAPFGRQMRINGVPVLVARPDPSQWLDGAVLSQRGMALTGGSGQAIGGFLAGELADEAARLIASQQGGAMVIEVRAPDGRIALQMSGFGNARSYITGVLVEPAARLSNVVLRAAARNAVIPLDLRLALEAELLAAAAEVMEQVETAAGPDPAFESADAVSSN